MPPAKQYTQMKALNGWYRLLLVIVFIALVEPISVLAQKQPKGILLLTDHLGWSCLSAQMDDRIKTSKSDYYETPDMVRLARQGMRLSRGYAPEPMSTPSKRSIQFVQTSIRQGDEPANLQTECKKHNKAEEDKTNNSQ